MTVRAFALAIDKFVAETIPAEVEKLQRVITLQALSGVVLRTPVATGRARGNWQVSLEVPVLDVLERLDASGGSTINIESEKLAGLKAFSITYLQNNLPYIERLEDGSSTQAPGGMVAVTIASIEAQFQ